ncbi:MAG: hypothetical protein ACOYLO_15605 [Ferruginibacter sp.]
MLKFIGYIIGLLGVALLVRHAVAYFMGKKSGLTGKGLLASILLTLVGAFIIKKSKK